MSSEKNTSTITKRIPENKLKAFSIGKTNPMPKKGSVLKRREKEHEKKKLDIEETQQVFDEFVQSFEDIQNVGKTFVRGSTINPEKEIDSAGQPKIYNPVIDKIKSEIPSKPDSDDSTNKRKKIKESKKSILESFKEELKRTQRERDDRHSTKTTEPENSASPLEPNINQLESFPIKQEMIDESTENRFGYLESGDPQSTNLYVGNINPKMNEEMLCQVFGKFGPLASVKVMWPRTDEEKARNNNCGFVAYMKREHALEALNQLKGTQLLDFAIQLGWGKLVPLPMNPVYVHQELITIKPAPPQLPDPPSGLPFNAQLQNDSKDAKDFSNQDNPARNDPEILSRSVIRVVLPSDEDLVARIHRMIEFVVREGPMFEAMIMTREINNQDFRFLFDNKSPPHIYYRWKLFSILQGDSPETWRTEEFCMFKNGSIWRPPPLQPVELPDLKPKVSEIDIVRKGRLSEHNRDEFEDILREVTMERKSILSAMAFCVDHSNSWEEIIECITESLVILETPIFKKIARLYLISDLVNNTSVKFIESASNFRNGFDKNLNAIFEHFSEAYDAISDQLHAEHFKINILKILFAWEKRKNFSLEFLLGLKRLFLPNSNLEQLADEKILENLDGQPLESFDGANLEDLDGTPMPSELDGTPLNIQYDKAAHEAKFKPIGHFVSIESEEKQRKSKWELIDDPLDEILEEAVEKEQLQQIPKAQKTKDSSLFLSGSNLNENMRQKLREIEVKVSKFADELESLHSKKDLGKEANRGFIEQKVEGYRKVLLDDFYQVYGLDTATEPVSMDISKPASTVTTQTSKASKFFSQYTDSDSESSQESLPKRKKNKSKSKSHKSDSRSTKETRSRSRSFSSESLSSEIGSPTREFKIHEHTHHSKKSKRRHSPSDSRTSKKDRNHSSKKEKSSKKRKSSSISPSHHSRAKSSKKSRRHSSESRSPSPQKRSKKSKHT